jgi:hypothetical protein
MRIIRRIVLPAGDLIVAASAPWSGLLVGEGEPPSSDSLRMTEIRRGIPLRARLDPGRWLQIVRSVLDRTCLRLEP